MDSKKFIEIKKPIEEVREIKEEEIKLEVPKVEKTEATQETSSNSDREKEFEEGYKQAVGTAVEVTDAVCLPVGAAETAVLGGGGAITEGIGKMTGDERTKAAGRVLEGSATKPLEDTGKGIKKVGKEIKKIFD